MPRPLYVVLAKLFNGVLPDRPGARRRFVVCGAGSERDLVASVERGQFPAKRGNKDAPITPFLSVFPHSERCGLSPASATASADHVETAGVPLTPQHIPEHVPTHAGASVVQLGRGEVTDHLADGP